MRANAKFQPFLWAWVILYSGYGQGEKGSMRIGVGFGHKFFAWTSPNVGVTLVTINILEYNFIWIFEVINNLVNQLLHVFELQMSTIDNEYILFKT